MILIMLYNYETKVVMYVFKENDYPTYSEKSSCIKCIKVCFEIHVV